MSHLGTLSPSPFLVENFKNNKTSPNDKKKRNKGVKNTVTQEKKNSSKVNKMIAEIHADSEDNDKFSDYAPTTLPESDINESMHVMNTYNESDNETLSDVNDPGISNEMNKYYKNSNPYVSNETSGGSSNDLMNKLDNILHILEEQKDDKTGHVAEEVILYSFLGIFMIFICDSFARAGKYVR